MRHINRQLSRRSFLAGALAFGTLAPLARGTLTWAATPGSAVYQETRPAMGTFVRVDVAGAPDELAREAVSRAFARALELEAELTRHEASSPLGVLNTQGSLRDVPASLSLLLERSATIHALTAGSFDPSVLPLLSALQKGFETGTEPDAREMADLLSHVDFGRVRTGSGVRIDTGMALSLDGIAKGHIAEAMSRELAAAGCVNHLVNAGGDIHAMGSPKGRSGWNIAIQSPFRQSRVRGTVTLTRGALATSGVYEKDFGHGLSHLVIPRTLNRPEVVSASVVAPEGALADALATAFCVQSPADTLAQCRSMKGVEALLVRRDGRVVRSAGWPV